MQKTIKEATTEELLKAKIDIMQQMITLNGSLSSIDGELKERESKQPLTPVVDPEKPLETE